VGSAYLRKYRIRLIGIMCDLYEILSTYLICPDGSRNEGFRPFYWGAWCLALHWQHLYFWPELQRRRLRMMGKGSEIGVMYEKQSELYISSTFGDPTTETNHRYAWEGNGCQE
jgi:hypothetical protein